MQRSHLHSNVVRSVLSCAGELATPKTFTSRFLKMKHKNEIKFIQQVLFYSIFFKFQHDLFLDNLQKFASFFIGEMEISRSVKKMLDKVFNELQRKL